jgi:hypothetical protein
LALSNITNEQILEATLSRINDRLPSVAAFCIKCDKEVVMKLHIFIQEYYKCPNCMTTYDCTFRNIEPTIIDLINFNREKLE